MTMFETLTLPGLEPTESPSMSSAEDSRARTSALPAREQASRASGRGYGASTRESLASFDPVTWSWKTSQRCLVEGWATYSQTWPRSGMTRSGTAYRLPPLALRMNATGYGLWPTPTTDSATNRSSRYAQGGMPLAAAVKLWPTPTANQQNAASIPALLNEEKRLHPRGQWSLGTQVAAEHVYGNRMWPTPTAQDAKNATLPPSQASRDSLPGALLREGASGRLNPAWVEWLMGFPEGWTDCER